MSLPMSWRKKVQLLVQVLLLALVHLRLVLLQKAIEKKKIWSRKDQIWSRKDQRNSGIPLWPQPLQGWGWLPAIRVGTLMA